MYESKESDKQAQRLETDLEALVDYFGESYSNLSGANAALNTVNRDIDACLSFLQRQQRREASAQTSTSSSTSSTAPSSKPREVEEEEEVTEVELPDEIEKILAKARRVVNPVTAKAADGKKKGKSKVQAKGKAKREQVSKKGGRDEAQGDNTSVAKVHKVKLKPEPRLEVNNASPKPEPKSKEAQPNGRSRIRLPQSVKAARETVLELSAGLIENGHFVASASSSFNDRALKILGSCSQRQPSALALAAEEGSLAHDLRKMVKMEQELNDSLDEAEGMTKSDQAMLRAKTKDLLEQRRRLHSRLKRLSEYGQQWRSIAGSAKIQDREQSDGDVSNEMNKITCSGKLNALSLQWIPEKHFGTLQDLDLVGEVKGVLHKPICVPSRKKKFQRKHEISAKARGLLQQKLLQLCVEGKFMANLLDDAKALMRNQTTRDMTMADAISLERFVALCRFNQQLYLDSKSKPSGGGAFFFRQEQVEQNHHHEHEE